jgi:hypothetical protein
MSLENLKKYGRLCSENDDVRKKAKEIGVNDMDGQIANAKSLGLEIFREDFAAMLKEAGLNGKNELSEEELKKVAGGSLSLTAACLVGFLLAGGAVGITATNQPRW